MAQLGAMAPILRFLLACGACSLLTACEPVAIALLGAGASTALRYNMDGVAARTFTAPAAEVRSASLSALERMGLSIDNHTTFDEGEVIYARAANREIEVELEPITKQATRVRVTARGGSFFYDNATAIELVQQTGKALDATMTAKAAAPAAAAAGASLTSN
jgi:hypothetical protein